MRQDDELHLLLAKLWGEYSSAKVADAILAEGYRKPSPWIPADHHDGGGYKKAGPEDIPWLLVNIEWLMSEVKRLTPREIRSADELDALPVGSVVLDVDGEPWKKLRPNLWASRDSCEESATVFWTHSEIHPTVLHEPEEGR